MLAQSESQRYEAWFRLVCQMAGAGQDTGDYLTPRFGTSEMTLGDTQSLQRAILENAGYAIIATTTEGTIVSFNPAAERMLGYRADELVGRETPACFHDLDEVVRRAGEFSDELGEIIEPGFEVFVAKARRDLPNEYEWTYVRKDGHRFPVLLSVTALRDPEGAITGFLGMARDITETRQAQQALAQVSNLQRAILENAGYAIIASTTEGTIISFNPAAERMLGYRADELVGRETPACFHDLDEVIRRAGEFSDELGETIEPGFEVFVAKARRDLPNEHEWMYVHKDGQRFPILLSVTALRDPEGAITGFLGMARDITETRQAQQALEAELRERTRREDELREAKKAAESASRAKSDFLANMSHEIRTPMNAIIGMTELVLDTQLEPSQRNYLKMVQESGDALLSIINDILDFSKIEACKLDLEETIFGLRERAGDIMKSLALRAHEKGLELAWRIHPDVPDALVGDPGRLGQIIINLAGNAIKFTEQGEVVLGITCESHTDKDAVLRFSISDTGIGIPEDKLDSIFGAFTQADTSTTRKYGGTGLGLAISSRLVELMGGRIWAESTVGTGSTFHFTARFELATGKPPEPSRIRPAVVKGTHVLIVDDNATNRLILEEMTRNWGMQPQAVSSAREALDTLRKARAAGDPIKLVLSDVNMPEVDGLTLTEWIRQDPELADTTVIVLTSGARSEDIKRCAELKIAAHLMKPVKQSELFDSIGMSLGIAVPEDDGEELLGHDRPVDLPALCVLLAEDSIVNQKLAIGLLEKHGHTVIVANNGKEAIAALKARKFDVVLMDVEMPEIDGLEATAVIRVEEQRTGGHIPIIAMTAHAMKGDRERCLEAGMDDYVPKPIRARQLFETLEKVHQEHRR